jgi:hypothetical protein
MNRHTLLFFVILSFFFLQRPLAARFWLTSQRGAPYRLNVIAVAVKNLAVLQELKKDGKNRVVARLSQRWRSELAFAVHPEI